MHALFGHVQFSVVDQLMHLAPQAPLRPRGANRTAPALAQLGAQQPSIGVIEAFARITTGGRRRAMAFRLEASADRPRWRCTALELDGQG